jgi:1,2-phenylacetyl-CoA epoxidase PaaB subunit
LGGVRGQLSHHIKTSNLATETNIALMMAQDTMLFERERMEIIAG